MNCLTSTSVLTSQIGHTRPDQSLNSRRLCYYWWDLLRRLAQSVSVSCSLSSISCDDFETISWFGVPWDLAHARSQSSAGGWGSGCSETLSPAPRSGSGCTSAASASARTQTLEVETHTNLHFGTSALNALLRMILPPKGKNCLLWAYLYGFCGSRCKFYDLLWLCGVIFPRRPQHEVYLPGLTIMHFVYISSWTSEVTYKPLTRPVIPPQSPNPTLSPRDTPGVG